MPRLVIAVGRETSDRSYQVLSVGTDVDAAIRELENAGNDGEIIDGGVIVDPDLRHKKNFEHVISAQADRAAEAAKALAIQLAAEKAAGEKAAAEKAATEKAAAEKAAAEKAAAEKAAAEKAAAEKAGQSGSDEIPPTTKTGDSGAPAETNPPVVVTAKKK